MKYIDINADMGESPEALEDGRDQELMRYITSANIACGGHAGDDQTMRQTLELAKRFHVAAGAHPGYPDRKNFGRVAVQMDAAELEQSLAGQIQSLRVSAQKIGIRIGHVKAHGALYHATNTDSEVARVFSRTVLQADPSMIVVAQSGSPALSIFRDMGLRTATEAFCDRAYEPDGTLRNRKLPGAMLDAPTRAALQAASIALDGRIAAVDGSLLQVAADTLCLHSDTPQSVAIACEVRRVLAAKGVHVQSLGNNKDSANQVK